MAIGKKEEKMKHLNAKLEFFSKLNPPVAKNVSEKNKKACFGFDSFIPETWWKDLLKRKLTR